MNLFDVIDFFTWDSRRRRENDPRVVALILVFFVLLAIVILVNNRMNEVDRVVGPLPRYTTSVGASKSEEVFRGMAQLNLDKINPPDGATVYFEDVWLEAGIDYEEVTPLAYRKFIVEDLVLNIRTPGIRFYQTALAYNIDFMIQGRKAAIFMSEGCTVIRFPLADSLAEQLQQDGLLISVLMNDQEVGKMKVSTERSNRTP